MEFEVTLVDFDKQPNWHAMSAADKIARADVLKEQGNAVFRLGPEQYARAVSKWQKAVKLVDNALDIDTDEQVTPQAVRRCLQHFPPSCRYLRALVPFACSHIP